MSGLNAVRLLLKLSILVALVGSLWFYSSDAAIQSSRVSVDSQPDSPLLISSITTDSNQPGGTQPVMTRITAVITNVSNIPIRAFAISHGAAGNRDKSGVMSVNILSLEDILQPDQSKSFNVVTKPRAEVDNGLILAVDFVEFIDGTTWGLDKFNSAQQLAGQRAGAAAAKEYFLKVVQEQGLNAAINTIILKEAQVFPPDHQTLDWKDGFSKGVIILQDRLRRAQQKGGRAKLETELQQPYDASEGRRNQ